MSPATTSPCPYCGEASRRIFTASDWNQRTSPNQFAYLSCKKCSLIFIEQIPSDLSSYYRNEQYDIPPDLNSFRGRADSQQWKVDLLKTLCPGGDLFEVGPATGEFAFAARAEGFRPRLAEMDVHCSAFLRDVLGFEVINTDNPVEALAPGDKYAAICVWQAIEHIPEFWRFLDRAAGRLATDGVLVVSTPNPKSVQAKLLGRFWPHIDAPRHLYLIPRPWFGSFASRHNLAVVLNTTRDVGSRGLNYYGWYLAVRNLVRDKLSDSKIRALAGRITALLRPFEGAEDCGCSYTIAFRKNKR